MKLIESESGGGGGREAELTKPKVKVKQKLHQAIDLLYSHGPASFDDYTRFVLHCARANDFIQAKRLQSHIELNLFQPKDSFIHNQLVHLYAKFGKLSDAQYVFDNMTKRNVYSWNALLSAYAKMGMVENLRVVFDQMPCYYSVSYNTLIACFASNGHSGNALKVLVRMQEDGFQANPLSGLKPDLVTVSNVLNAYFQCGHAYDARNLFSKLPKKDEICWTTMIVGYAQNGREEDAWMLFGDMLCRNVKPDSYTISSMVSSCAKLASLYHGQVVHGKVVVMGIDNNMLIFETMPIQNVITWNAMILGYAQNGQKYFDSISEQQMTPTLDHYACMITLLGRSGRIDKAMDLIQGMPHEPNYHIWSTLLFVCAKGDLKNAELAASLLFELDPHNAGPYIMLSNLYAACGKWKDVAVVRSLMKEKNAKKFAAYSWVEIQTLSYTLWGRKKSLDPFLTNEKLALAFALIRKPNGVAPIRIIKNVRLKMFGTLRQVYSEVIDHYFALNEQCFKGYFDVSASKDSLNEIGSLSKIPVPEFIDVSPFLISTKGFRHLTCAIGPIN
ncbi:Pentatricopeptide repeat-containing protein [Glycine soja]|uniref:Pentatricopeptide repeat-containing protein n=1 Tax=Glycine soja TaxID=3848 RepID=A0A445J9D0_GLYSO|nr:Pentatricopeptide repeat-containing protein [Glycine soja]